MAESSSFASEKVRSRETPEERKAHLVEHSDREQELEKEQRELSTTIKILEKELEKARQILDTIPAAAQNTGHTEGKLHKEFISALDKRSTNTAEIDILKELQWFERVGSDLRNFLTNPENLGIITLVLMMTPGMGIMADIVRRGQQVPEIQMALSTVFTGGLTAIGGAGWYLINRFKESQEMVQNKIDSLRQELNNWQSNSS